MSKLVSSTNKLIQRSKFDLPFALSFSTSLWCCLPWQPVCPGSCRQLHERAHREPQLLWQDHHYHHNHSHNNHNHHNHNHHHHQHQFFSSQAKPLHHLGSASLASLTCQLTVLLDFSSLNSARLMTVAPKVGEILHFSSEKKTYLQRFSL